VLRASVALPSSEEAKAAVIAVVAMVVVVMVVVLDVVVMVVVAVAVVVVATVLRRVVVWRRLLALVEVSLVPLLLRRRVVRALLRAGRRRRRVHRRIPCKPTDQEPRLDAADGANWPNWGKTERVWGNSREVDRWLGICLAEAGSSSSLVGAGRRSLGFAYFLLVIHGGR
jgi:hypothetical protein